ncbi:family 16 glycoside hydrolase [Sphingobacterium sp. HJSM2_6]|uniref:family 16 glycoside hydrolase n=1 Tax=Sphingobacterium sp. HJSM2_6 TaxID=3366264 RepID=UPI003BC69DE4
MKKVFNTISALLFLQVAAFAQQPAGRTTATKIADVLAQQPAEEQTKYLSAMKELEGFSTADISALLAGLKPQGGKNAALEYAANSYSYYVLQPGFESQRATYVAGLLDALDKVNDKNNKGFILEILKKCAKNDAISKVVPYLADEELADKAALVLNAIRTPEAAAALNTALASANSEKTATLIIAALGDLESPEAETKIIELLDKYPTDNFQHNALTALSKIAGAQSSALFLKKAQEKNYQFDRSNVSSLAVDYAENLVKKNASAAAHKFASTLFKNAGKAKASGIQAAALTVLTSIEPAKQKKQLLKLVSSDDAVLRNVALGLLADKASASDLAKLASSVKKLSPDAQESVFNFLASKDATASISSIEKSYASLKDEEAKIAALNSLSVLTKGSNAAFLIQQIPSASDNELKTIKNLLLSAKDKGTIDVVNNALTSADSKTQLALLDVLSNRTNANSSASVLGLSKSTDAGVRLAAYKALANVVDGKDFDAVSELLGSASADELASVQRAAIISLNASADKEAKIQKLAANISRSAAPSAGKYFPIFAGVGGADALKAVENYVANAGLKGQAIQALANWANAESLPALIKLSRTEKDPALFNNIFTGLIKQLNAGGFKPEQKTLLLKDAFSIAQTVDQKKSVLSNLQSTGTYHAFAFASKFLDDAQLGGTATNVAMNIAMDNKAYVGADVERVLNAAAERLSGSESSYLKEAVIRHLAEMPKEAGFVYMFNGKDLSGWKGLVENPIARAKMSKEELAKKQVEADKKMRDNWSAIDGDMVFSGHGDNIASVKQYGDFEMLVDWKLDPKGHEPDAGIYLRGTPQIQIWDISRTNVGAQVGSGGLYNNTKHAKDPIKVADNALGEWNNFKIRMIGDNVWVWLNGELVVDNVPLENYWDRNQSIFPKEQIELQAHGSRVWYRDILIKEIPKKEIFTLSEQEKKEGFEMLFDGTNLDKWTETAAYDITNDGSIRSNPDTEHGTNLYTKEQYTDFVYRFEFKLTPGANNGVGIRTPMGVDAAYNGMEIQILDDGADVYKDLQPYQYHGSVYGIIAAKRGSLNPVGEWNTEEIRVQGNKIKITVNGKVIVDGDLAAATKSGSVDKKDHPGLFNKSGHIGFLGHGTEVFLRNIRVKKL